MTNANLTGELTSRLALAAGQTGTDGRDGQRAIPQDLMRGKGDHRTVDASGKGHRATSQLPKTFEQFVAFARQQVHRRFTP